MSPLIRPASNQALTGKRSLGRTQDDRAKRLARITQVSNEQQAKAEADFAKAKELGYEPE